MLDKLSQPLTMSSAPYNPLSECDEEGMYQTQTKLAYTNLNWSTWAWSLVAMVELVIIVTLLGIIYSTPQSCGKPYCA